MVQLCTAKKQGHECKTLKMPDEAGPITQIATDGYTPTANSWLTFGPENINLCVAAVRGIRCTSVSPNRIGKIRVGYDEHSEDPSITFTAGTADATEVATADKLLRERIAVAASRLLSKEPATAAPCMGDSCKPRSLEEPSDPGMPVVYITAPFPAISVVDGAVDMIAVGIVDGQTGNMPDPLPDGVAPSDYINARDPKRFTACVAAWYRVYVTMVQGCMGDFAYPTSVKRCIDKSFQAYVKNLREDCYPNYFD
jgi:hypothetical protein